MWWEKILQWLFSHVFIVREIFSFFKFLLLNPKSSLLERLMHWKLWDSITCYFEYFSWPRIWEIVPDYIKKVTNLKNLDWKKIMELRRQSMQVMQKVPTTSCFFITCLLIFYTAYLIIFMSNFYFIFESILNQSFFLLQFFNPVGKNHEYLQKFVLG